MVQPLWKTILQSLKIEQLSCDLATLEREGEKERGEGEGESWGYTKEK